MRLTLDAYSGLANPSLDIPEALASRVFSIFGDNGFLSGGFASEMPGRLGYRGIELALPTGFSSRYKIPGLLKFPAIQPISHLALLRDLHDAIRAALFAGFDFLKWLFERIKAIIATLPPASPPTGSSGPSTPCKFETLAFDPDTWNNSPFVRTNNCYAYACNKLSNYASKPQPGVASGAMFTPPPTGPDVAAAAKRDGAHEINDCFADAEAPRHLVALVIWPGEDYHWYRKHPDCWGHKPGSTPARNIDSSRNVITNPETCDRGPYTIFHGYLLVPNSQRVAA